MKNKYDILIIGAGFGGLFTARRLAQIAKSQNLPFEVTLIDSKNYFLFVPLFHELATGALSRNELTTPLSKNLIPDIIFLNNKVEIIQLDRNSVILDDGKEILFDYLVISTGSKPLIPNIKGFSENSLTLKSLQDAEKIKYSILELMEDPDKSEKCINIIGSGPTGIELAGEILEYIYQIYGNNQKLENVCLNIISSSSTILYDFSSKTQDYVMNYLKNYSVKFYLNSNIQEVTSEKIILDNNIELKSDLTISAVGVVANIPKVFPDIASDQKGRLLSSKTLQFSLYPNIFALGDVVSGWPMDAQTAVNQSKIVTKNIVNHILGKPLLEYSDKKMGKLVSVGHRNAMAEIYNFKFYGKYVWYFWRGIYLFNMISWKKKIIVGTNWFLNLFTLRDSSKI